MANPSGSYIYRAMHCPASCALPQVGITSDDAARGTALHRFLERVPQIGVEDALAEVPPQFLADAEAIQLDGLPLGPSYVREATYQYDLESGHAVFLGSGLGRGSYSISRRHVFGTIDVVGPTSVEDYKFEGLESHTEPAQSNPQLLFAALCKSRFEGGRLVDGALYHIKPDGSWWREPAQFDALDLDVFEAALRKCIHNVREAEAVVAAGQTPDVQRGNWCRYCGAASSCPAVTGLVRAMAAEPQLTADQIRAALTPATAAKAYARLAEVKQAINAVSQALYMYASEQPIELGDGKVYGPRESKRDAIDARKARFLLAEKFGVDVAENACTFETSKTAISKAVGAFKKQTNAPQSAAAMVRDVLDELRQQGAVETKVVNTVREYRNGEKDNG